MVKTPQYGRSSGPLKNKSSHLMELLREGRNVATTHSMFGRIPEEILRLVRENGYTMIVDEAIDVFTSTHFTRSDI